MSMDAIEVLITRASNGKLIEPAPDAQTLRLAFEAAARAPDHGALRPWRICVVASDMRMRFGELLAQAQKRKRADASAQELSTTQNKALRAPMILVVGARITAHAKVPAIEQIVSAAAAAQNILLTLHARGYAGILRTGDAAYDPEVKRAFGFEDADAIVGFIYAGTASQVATPRLRPSPDEFVQHWAG